MPKFRNPAGYTGRKGNSDHTGQVRFATNAEAVTGTATDLVISPASMSGAVDDLIPDATTTVAGKIRIATVAEAAAGVLTTVACNPAALAALVLAGSVAWSETVSGIGELATDAEAVTGTNSDKAIVPSSLVAKLAAPGAIGGTTPAAGAFTTLAATGAINFDAGGSLETGATALDLGADAGAGAINVGTGAAARVITVGNITGATQLVFNAGTAGIAMASTGAGDITIDSDDTLLLDSDGVLELNSSAGAISIGNDDIDQAMNLGTDGERVMTIGSNNGAAQLDLITGTGNFSIDGVAGTTYTIGATTTTGTVTLGGTAQTGTMTLGDSSGVNIVQIGSGEGATTVNIAGGATAAKVVNVAVGAVANLVTIGSATGAASLDLLCGTGNFTLEGGTASTYDISATGINTGTVTIAAGTGARTVNLATGGTGAKTLNVATGAIGNIVTIGTVSAAASLDLLCGTGNFTLEGNVASTYAISNTGVNTGQVDIAGGTGARTINIGAGGTGAKTLNICAAASADLITIGDATGAGSLDLVCGTGNFTLEGATASTYEISSTGVNTGTCKFASGTGARTVEIAGGGTGAKTVNLAAAASADVVTIGTSDGASSLDLACGTGNFTLEGATASTYEISSTGINTGTCKFASGTGARTVEIGGGGTGIKTINIGTAATADVITVGSSTAAGATTITAGTGGVTLGSGQIVNYTATNTAATPYAVLGTDYFIGTDTTGGVMQLDLPAAPETGRMYVVYDATGQAAIGGNVTVDGNGKNISFAGASAGSAVLNTAYESMVLVYNGTIWNARDVV